MIHEHNLAVAAAAMLRSLPAEHRGAVLDGMVSSHKATLARIRPDMLPAELSRRTLAYRASVEKAIGNG